MISSFDKELLRHGEKHSTQELQQLIEKTSSKDLIESIKNKLGRSDCAAFWNYLLQGFSRNAESKAKRFTCVQAFLTEISKVELTYKQMYDLITRLCLDLPSFTSEQLINIVDHCVDAIKIGDPKCVGWKELLPETISVLSNVSALDVNGMVIPGSEYRDTIVKNICFMKWPIEILTPIADMFRELTMSPSEKLIVLNKFSASLESIIPSEVPALSYQLFSMCTTAGQIIIPILALEKYFYRFYYKKLFADLDSNSTDFNSIDVYSDKELREAEETVLHHLNYCTQYKINEIQLCIVLRNFLSTPDVLLTPFVLSAVLSMTRANREPDTRLSTSVILPFLRTVIKNNEDEKKYAQYSVWCRDCLQIRRVDLDRTFTIMIDQNKEGKDTITPGLVNLAFVLLKEKNSSVIYELGMNFLIKFVRKRFVFGKGVVRKLAEWMVLDQEAVQYADCLTLLSTNDTYTVSECENSVNYILDFLLWIPGDHAMRMMTFILPILKISPAIRDSFIEILRKAINSSDAKTCRMGVYGFCMVLKQLNNSNSQRTSMNASGICTQQSISGFSLMSQATLGNRNNPQRHFDMLTLEIIGLLRNCFNQKIEIKYTLYENLQRAVELNPKLIPHVLQFIDGHFRSFFDTKTDDEEKFVININFSKLLHSVGDNGNEIEVKDNLGKLTHFVAHCLKAYDRFEHAYDTTKMCKILNTISEQIRIKEFKFETISGPLTLLKNETVMQQLNFLEGLMSYLILTSTSENSNVTTMYALFKLHHSIAEGLKSLSGGKKNIKTKPKGNNETEHHNSTVNGIVVKKINSKPENIWHLSDIELFLRLLHEEPVKFANSSAIAPLRSNREFVRYIYKVTASAVENLRNQPAYKQVSHSRRTLKILTDITKIIYEHCIKQLPSLWKNFDLKAAALCVECFYQCLNTANVVFLKKFDEFLKGVDYHPMNISSNRDATTIIQETIDQYMADEEELREDTDASFGAIIPSTLLQCLEILYDKISYSDRLTIESYTWLIDFCKNNEVFTKEMGIVHKLLFIQRQKTHSGMFFNTIAMHLEKVIGQVTDQPDLILNFQLKSITLTSAESCITYLYATLRKQIEEVEYFISKANSLHYKLKIIAEDEREMCLASLKRKERSVCSQLIHISNTLLHLSNVSLPLGTCMESLLRILIQMYTCLKNLAKHFLCRSSTSKLSIQGTKFDHLLQVVGKPLATNIYALITYIEANIFENRPKGKLLNPQAEKAKILRETKHIPRLILFVENFNKNVILLSKKTNDKLASFLHLGTVRDFRIKTSELKKAIDESMSHSSRINDNSDEEETDAQQIEEETLLDEIEAESSTPSDVLENEVNEDSRPKASSSSGHVAQEDDEVLQHESATSTNSQLLKNLAKINSQSKKRSIRSLEGVSMTSAPPPKKGKGRPSKKGK
ncbi:Fanconi anemia group I protein [Episyrphus balteatus]|uniref:Fanconi anemia group I protein n=1 Tax=Episyrphus balteatus TaxID=286459 RepID=UPI002486868C|nr:Fanconi anemia group I protein [Episyrphus balteatus]